MKIIVVDDDKIIRLGLSKVIGRLFEHHEVIADFANGATALEYLKENHYSIDLVVTDIKMPVMSGIELIKRAHETLKEVPLFIVLSGYDEFTYVRDSMKAGAFNYLLKPIRSEELTDIIKEVEAKLQTNEKNNKVFNKSIEVLKRDFFKNVLFSNKDIASIKENLLVDNIQLDEEYFYKMIIAKRDQEDSDIIKKFIGRVIKCNNKFEYSFFNYKDLIYIIFYYRNKENKKVDSVMQIIDSEADLFLECKKSVYVTEATDKVWKLRENSSLAKKMIEEFKDSSAKKYFLSNQDKLLEVLDNDTSGRNSSTITLAVNYIKENYTKNITLKDVADEVFLSQNYFSELFKRETGEGFYDFLSNYRIKKAKELLITTNLKIYEIAQLVGYNDSITFGRAFKKLTGVTPNNYRGKD
ncbi:response regulator [Clostridium manihotivorum]|uniref:Stage 0 sporulation protein A homolog n=1 Tax=Clostridium manihotivorum TaxID=2320868 RepID=A0A3R5TIR3_9CLOT|nr:helix-turn-helix domain-containing protein [Clostridium manihotivorum]QAA34443.1 DNA-binding response regulator [Clostridium manihotivorum]